MNHAKTFMKQHLVLFLLAVCLLGLGAGATAISLQATSKPVKAVMPAQSLSKEAYIDIRDRLIDKLKSADPRFAIAALKQEMETKPAVVRDCHELSHDLGQAAYQRYQSFGKAAEYQDEICTSGYIHGVMQAYFSTETDIFKEMTTICQDVRPGSFSRWECVHGVGHGLMYATQNNLPQSITACTVYANTADRSACTNGVYMENFATDQTMHPTRYRNENDPFYPCAEQTAANKVHCYFTAPIYFLSLNQDYTEAFRWCDTAEENYRDICTEGLGTQIMRRSIDNPKGAEQNCELGTARQKHHCITGIVDYYIAHFGSLEPAAKLCQELTSANKSQCETLITLQKDQF